DLERVEPLTTARNFGLMVVPGTRLCPATFEISPRHLEPKAREDPWLGGHSGFFAPAGSLAFPAPGALAPRPLGPTAHGTGVLRPQRPAAPHRSRAGRSLPPPGEFCRDPTRPGAGHSRGRGQALLAPSRCGLAGFPAGGLESYPPRPHSLRRFHAHPAIGQAR